MKCTVIRVIKYEGDEAAVRKAIQLSKPLGVTDCGKGADGQWSMTIAEHFNNLPNLVELTDAEVDEAIKPVLLPHVIETNAKMIYDSWSHHEGWVPWVPGGNSVMQDNARRAARRDLESL